VSALKVCLKKATYGELCSVTNYDSTLNLICGGSGYAVCPSNTFWNGSYCGMTHLLVLFNKTNIIINLPISSVFIGWP
jgi:hypothetical protein